MSDNHGAVWWSELMTRDVKAACDYYTKMCGWTYDEMPMEDGTYYVAKKGDQPVAGIMDMTPLAHLDQVPPHWFTYFAVDDVDAAAKETEAMGGTVRRLFDVPGIGRIAITEDPTGAVMGLMTPALQEA